MSQREGILYSLRVFNLRSKYYFALNYPNPSQFRSFYPNLGIFNPAPGRQTVTQHCAWRHSLANSCYQDTWGTNFARVRNPPQLSTLVLIPQRELKMHRILKSRPRDAWHCGYRRNKLAEPSFKSFVCFEWFWVASLPHREWSIKSFLNLFKKKKLNSNPFLTGDSHQRYKVSRPQCKSENANARCQGPRLPDDPWCLSMGSQWGALIGHKVAVRLSHWSTVPSLLVVAMLTMLTRYWRE